MRTLFIAFDPRLIDSHTLIVSILGYCIVLFTLSAMAYLMVRFHSVRDFIRTRRLKKETKPASAVPVKVVMTGEENAAIAAALYLFFSELHDQEKYVMTIKKVSRTYSPWSSKFYNIFNNMKHW
ncbi:MAG: OadG family protein [Bacteroidetes bacterium]|nr:OadG family protein [Bacteroidota bacterium]